MGIISGIHQNLSSSVPEVLTHFNLPNYKVTSPIIGFEIGNNRRKGLTWNIQVAGILNSKIELDTTKLSLTHTYGNLNFGYDLLKHKKWGLQPTIGFRFSSNSIELNYTKKRGPSGFFGYRFESEKIRKNQINALGSVRLIKASAHSYFALEASYSKGLNNSKWEGKDSVSINNLSTKKNDFVIYSLTVGVLFN